MNNQSKSSHRRVLRTALVVGVLGAMSGCSFMGECLRYEMQTMQVCERMETNGHCAHYGMRTRQVCAERASNSDRLY